MSLARELSLEQLSVFFSRRAEELATLDLRVPLKECAVLIKSDVSNNFQGSHAPDGTPWKPLKRKRSGKRHKGSIPKPLLDTGLLRASAVANGRGHVEEITANSLEVGSNLEYAGWQNDGTRTIPAREFIGFSNSLIADIEEVLADFLEANLL